MALALTSRDVNDDVDVNDRSKGRTLLFVSLIDNMELDEVCLNLGADVKAVDNLMSSPVDIIAANDNVLAIRKN